MKVLEDNRRAQSWSRSSHAARPALILSLKTRTCPENAAPIHRRLSDLIRHLLIYTPASTTQSWFVKADVKLEKIQGGKG